MSVLVSRTLSDCERQQIKREITEKTVEIKSHNEPGDELSVTTVKKTDKLPDKLEI